MAWGGMSVHGVTPLHKCVGMTKANDYLEILKNVMKPSAEALFNSRINFYFQEDNSPVHTAAIVKRLMQRQLFQRISWPPQSPDMSPIETLWNRIKQLPVIQKPKNKEDLNRFIQEI